MKNSDSSFLIKIFYDRVIINFGFVILCIACSYLAFNIVINKKETDIKTLENKITNLHNKKISLENQREDYVLRINSHSDPSWIELILKKELGVVPEGHIKVHFVNE